MAPIVTVLTDFGLRNELAGVIEGVIAGIAPEARVIHVSHGVPATNVRRGQTMFATAIRFLPVGIHLVVVDPGVGSERRSVVVRSPDGRLFVGPDNGVLIEAVDRCGGAAEAWAIAEPSLWLEDVSSTFHGRDVFAPVAAHLASGVEPSRVGPAIPVDSLIRLTARRAVVSPGVVAGTVAFVDGFGNVATDIAPGDLEASGALDGDTLEIAVGDYRFLGSYASTYADVGAGEIVVHVDAAGAIGVAVNRGSFASVAATGEGDAIVLRVRPR
jgi:S-adenosylmethionine hydrolase